MSKLQHFAHHNAILATICSKIHMCNAAIKYFKDLKIRTDYSDGDPDFEENFYILRHTRCPAVLVENFFYDNQKDLRFLESEEGRIAIENAISCGVRKFSALTMATKQ